MNKDRKYGLKNEGRLLAGIQTNIAFHISADPGEMAKKTTNED
jgi:hypothetical protein